jgi:hypothetical protein
MLGCSLCLQNPALQQYPNMDHVSDIEQELKRIAHELYKNPRISRVEINAQTLMGCSVSYSSMGDEDSPYCKALAFKHGLEEAKQNAIQIDKGPAIPYPRAPAASTKDIPGGLQQWMGKVQG